MSNLKKLASQTLWYGVSNIAARLLTSLLTPYLTYTMIGQQGLEQYGKFSFIYLFFPFLNVLYTYGMETSYFRFSRDAEDPVKLYRLQMTSMLVTTLLFSAAILLFREDAANFAEIGEAPYYINWIVLILGLDAITALPYARLRRENRPRKYALTKVLGIVVYVATIVFLFSFGKQAAAMMPGNYFAAWYDKHWGLGFILFANALQCFVTIALLSKEFLDFKPVWDRPLLKKIMIYGFPILIAGFAGTINDTINRMMFTKLYPASATENTIQLGIFSAILKLSIMISLAVQAFKMAAEPFFFSISKDENARANYARIMLWFCITLAMMFLNITLFIDLWKYFVGPEYRQALYLIPILLLSNIFLGVYYNLTIWYKLTDQTKYGAYIMLVGAACTVVFNYFFIARLGFAACAYSMLLSSTVMMVLCYLLGQRYYPVPYPVRRIAFYFLWMLVFAAVQGIAQVLIPQPVVRITLAGVLSVAFIMLILRTEDLQLANIMQAVRRRK